MSAGSSDLPRHALEGRAPSSRAAVAVEPLGDASRAPFAHRHDFFEIVHATAGSGSHVVDFAAHPIRPQTLWFLVPGQVHRWDCEVSVEGRLVLFGEELLLDGPGHLGALDELAALHALSAAGPIGLGPDDAARVGALVAEMERECTEQALGWASVARAHLHVLVVLAQRAHEAAAPPRMQEIGRGTALARQFQRLVNERLVATPTVQAYASRLGVTAGHLSDTVREATGRSPGELIRARDALEAKRLLAHTDLTVAEVAARLGFDDPSYFGRFFKRETDESPGGFRGRVRDGCQSPRSASLPGRAAAS